jgi:hypothetical protein
MVDGTGAGEKVGARTQSLVRRDFRCGYPCSVAAASPDTAAKRSDVNG